MRARIQFSTDVAALGIWDRTHPVATGRSVASIEELARRGEACILHLGEDTGGAVDVFVDEDIPPELLAESTPLAEERTVVVLSGDVVIDGVEYFGRTERMQSIQSSTCRLPNGVYRIRIHATKDEDSLPEPSSEKEIRRLIGSADVDYYDRTNRNALLIGLSIWLLLPVLLLVMPWFVAVAITLIAFVAYFHLQQWIVRRIPRYQKVADRMALLRLAGERALLSVQFSTWQAALLGGPPLTLPDE